MVMVGTLITQTPSDVLAIGRWNHHQTIRDGHGKSSSSGILLRSRLPVLRLGLPFAVHRSVMEFQEVTRADNLPRLFSNPDLDACFAKRLCQVRRLPKCDLFVVAFNYSNVSGYEHLHWYVSSKELPVI